MPVSPAARRTLRVLVGAVALWVTMSPVDVDADGLWDTISGQDRLTYSLSSTKTTDAAGITTKTGSTNINGTTELKVDYSLLPTLRLNGGGRYDHTRSMPTGDDAAGETRVSTIRPFMWLNFRDPVFDSALGYELTDQQTKVAEQPLATLTRETYTGTFGWHPADLPATEVRYNRITTHDGDRTLIDTRQDFFYLKSEYVYGGFRASYSNTNTSTRDEIRDAETSQTTHEGRVVYGSTFLGGRVAVATEHRLQLTETRADSAAARSGAIGTSSALQVSANLGLFALDDTPEDGPALASTPALIDADTATSAGINLGFTPGDTVKRNIGLDFQTATSVSRLWVWVDRNLTTTAAGDVSGRYSWDIYTSADNLTWTFHVTIFPAPFGPFDNRFELNFPAVTARYVKAVTRPLAAPILGAPDQNVFVTELQAFLDRSAAGQRAGRTVTSETTLNSTFDIRVLLLRAPMLTYNINGTYQRTEPEGDYQYRLTNGLFLDHRLTRILTTNASAALELGRRHAATSDTTDTTIRYLAGLAATPLPTLADRLVFSGTQQRTTTTQTATTNQPGEATTMNHSLGLYNTAQLYRGIDASLNLTGTLASDEQQGTPEIRRRDVSANLGLGVTPNPALTTSLYYTRRMSHVEGGATPPSTPDTTEDRLDLGATFTPFRSLFLTSATSIAAVTGRETTIQQNYSASWAPFPDGNLQFSFLYTQTYTQSENPDSSRIIQPSLRWYLTSRRRAYLEATYQINTTESTATKSDTRVFSTTLTTYF